MNKIRDIIIIGSGLAGSTAAIEAAKSGYKVLGLTKVNDNGYWHRVKKIRNYPGLETEITGSELIKRIRKEAEQFDAAFQEYDVKEIKETESHTYEVKGSNSETYEASAIIVASGSSKDEHFLAGERELVGKGVFYSVQNEAPFLKHQSATIIGKNQEAADAALHLARFAERISFIIPSSKLDVSDELIRELEANRKIELFFSSSIKKLNGNEGLHSVTILSAGDEKEIKTRAAFIYTYRLRPCTEFIKKLVKLDEESGRILVHNDFSTSKKGIFACGDVLTGRIQNEIITSAQGLNAAINAEKYLSA